MLLRRKTLMALACATVALGTVVIPAVADELLGTITKVDVEGKTMVVTTKDGKETHVAITDETKLMSKKGSARVDLEKLETRVKKTQDAGKKGVMAKIELEKGVASKIYLRARPVPDIEDPVPPTKKP
jgi:uncharacterized membrane protein